MEHKTNSNTGNQSHTGKFRKEKYESPLATLNEAIARAIARTLQTGKTVAVKIGNGYLVPDKRRNEIALRLMDKNGRQLAYLYSGSATADEAIKNWGEIVARVNGNSAELLRLIDENEALKDLHSKISLVKEGRIDYGAAYDIVISAGRGLANWSARYELDESAPKNRKEIAALGKRLSDAINPIVEMMSVKTGYGLRGLEMDLSSIGIEQVNGPKGTFIDGMGRESGRG